MNTTQAPILAKSNNKQSLYTIFLWIKVLFVKGNTVFIIDIGQLNYNIKFLHVHTVIYYHTSTFTRSNCWLNYKKLYTSSYITAFTCDMTQRKNMWQCFTLINKIIIIPAASQMNVVAPMFVFCAFSGYFSITSTLRSAALWIITWGWYQTQIIYSRKSKTNNCNILSWLFYIHICCFSQS